MKPLEFHRENLAKHGVRPEEVEQCFRQGIPKYLHKVGRKKYQLISQTLGGRYLEVIYREELDHNFVFHAMEARQWHIRLLKRRGKRR